MQEGLLSNPGASESIMWFRVCPPHRPRGGSRRDLKTIEYSMSLSRGVGFWPEREGLIKSMPPDSSRGAGVLAGSRCPECLGDIFHAMRGGPIGDILIDWSGGDRVRRGFGAFRFGRRRLHRAISNASRLMRWKPIVGRAGSRRLHIGCRFPRMPREQEWNMPDQQSRLSFLSDEVVTPDQQALRKPA